MERDSEVLNSELYITEKMERDSEVLNNELYITEKMEKEVLSEESHITEKMEKEVLSEESHITEKMEKKVLSEESHITEKMEKEVLSEESHITEKMEKEVLSEESHITEKMEKDSEVLSEESHITEKMEKEVLSEESHITEKMEKDSEVLSEESQFTEKMEKEVLSEESHITVKMEKDSKVLSEESHITEKMEKDSEVLSEESHITEKMEKEVLSEESHITEKMEKDSEVLSEESHITEKMEKDSEVLNAESNITALRNEAELMSLGDTAQGDGQQNKTEETLESTQPVLYTDRTTFFKSIHSDFLNLVQPNETELIDELRALDAIDSGAEEEVMAEKTRRDKARKLWSVLCRVPHNVFRDKCLPILQRLYPHVIKGAELSAQEKDDRMTDCLRHQIMKHWKPKYFTDVFMSAKCCTLEEYSEIADSNKSDKMIWNLVFRLIKQHRHESVFCDLVLKMLKDNGVEKPHHFDEVLRNEFHCTCVGDSRAALRKSKKKRQNTTSSGLLFANQSSTRPFLNSKPSAGSGVTSDEDRSLISCMDTQQIRTEECFHARRDKLKYLTVMEDINSALTMASSFQAKYKELEGLKLASHVLAETAQDESHLSFDDRTRLSKFSGRAINLCDEMQTHSKNISKTLQESEENIRILTSENSVQLPSQRHEHLLKRCSELKRKSKGVQHSLSISVHVKNEIVHICKISPV